MMIVLMFPCKGTIAVCPVMRCTPLTEPFQAWHDRCAPLRPCNDLPLPYFKERK